MAIAFDRILIAVPDLPTAIEQYQQLFGVQPYRFTNLQGAQEAWWGLQNTVIAVVQRPFAKPHVEGIAVNSGIAQSDKALSNTLGINIILCDALNSTEFRREHPLSQCIGWSVDHVVLRTDDAQACIELFAKQLDMRLALDKTEPQWGGRMLFFRAGKLTLEVIASDNDITPGSFFWGLAYQCDNLAERVQQLQLREVLVSDIRDGRKPGTLVATVKSHCLDIPTLLIQKSPT